MLRWFSKRRMEAQRAKPTGEATFAATEALSDWVDTLPLPQGSGAPGEAAPWMGPDVPPLAAQMAAPTVDRAAAEQRRLAALDARGEGASPYLAEAAARICQTPIAAITLLDGGGHWSMEAGMGIGPECAALLAPHFAPPAEHGARLTVLNDLANDQQFKPPPPALAREGICAYASAPLVTARGAQLGTLWVADRQPRDFSPVQLRTLQLLARQTALLLDARGRS